jgi:hypothetical protein
MHSARTLEFGIRFVVDASPLLLVVLGSVPFFVSFKGDVDGNEIAVEQADNLVVRERTAP